MNRDEIIREVEEYLASRESDPLLASVAALKETLESFDQPGMARIIKQLDKVSASFDAKEGEL